jgi:hypothetical protein
VAALAASAPLVTRHGHRPAACTAFGLAAAGLLLLSRVPAHDADALDLVPAMLVALDVGLGLPALQGTALHGSAAADAGLAAGMIACVQQVGVAAGLAVLTTLAFRRAASAIAAASLTRPPPLRLPAGVQLAGLARPPTPPWCCSRPTTPGGAPPPLGAVTGTDPPALLANSAYVAPAWVVTGGGSGCPSKSRSGRGGPVGRTPSQQPLTPARTRPRPGCARYASAAYRGRPLKGFRAWG